MVEYESSVTWKEKRQVYLHPASLSLLAYILPISPIPMIPIETFSILVAAPSCSFGRCDSPLSPAALKETRRQEVRALNSNKMPHGFSRLRRKRRLSHLCSHTAFTGVNCGREKFEGQKLPTY